MRVAVEGCCHGELDKIYETIQYAEEVNNFKIDLLLICGDFQAVRNKNDMKSMAVPHKYKQLQTFHKYYSGEKVAPVLTIFIGGNHEASNYLQELPYGGWVAKNIYYMGYANVIQVGGVRIGGLSGIFKGKDYQKGHHEKPPYSDDAVRSVYHIRNLEVFRLKQLSRHVDIFMSHDWPRGVAKHGNVWQLTKKKPFLKEEIEKDTLGSGPAAELLFKMKPSYWFAAHLHVKFAASVEHSSLEGKQFTKFLSLDKCLPGRDFLQILEIPSREEGPVKIKLDPEWLSVLKSTNHLLNLNNTLNYMPGPGGNPDERYDFGVSDQDIADITMLFGGNLTVPENFEHTAPTLFEESKGKMSDSLILVNPQTALLCEMLDITNPNAIFTNTNSSNFLSTKINVDLGSDDTDDVPDDDDDDEMPSDISSTFDTSGVGCSDISYVDSSFGDSESLSKPNSAVGSTTPATHVMEVADDDDELQAILSAQKQNSQNLENLSSISYDTIKQDSDKSPSEESKLSGLSPSPKSQVSQEEGDEFAIIMAAQQQKSEQGSSDSDKSGATSGSVASASLNKSSSEADYSSQESQDESFPLGAKRPSPNNSTGSAKKLKRRNVSMYCSSGTEDDVS